jgi:hypothetical protein
MAYNQDVERFRDEEYPTMKGKVPYSHLFMVTKWLTAVMSSTTVKKWT